MRTPSLSFIIVNYNGGAMLRDCLDSITRQTLPDYEVIVVDNGSSDDSYVVPHFERPGWRLIKLQQNAGFSSGNNIALAKSKAPFIALVNNDVILESAWAMRMLEAFTSDQIGSVACRLLQNANPDLIDSAGFEYFGVGTVNAWENRPAAFFSGRTHRPFGAVASAAVYRRTALDKAGLFHDRYFAYYEDTDLAIRLRLHGYDCAYVDDAVGYHRGSATGHRRSVFHTYQLRRNIELLYGVNMIDGLAWRYAVPHLLYETLTFAGAMVRGNTRAWFRAKRAAMAALPWILEERSRLRKNIADPGASAHLRKHLSPWWRAFFRPYKQVKRTEYSRSPKSPGITDDVPNHP